MPDNQEFQQLKDILSLHQHTGYDGSTRLALLDWKIIARNILPVAATSLVMDNIPQKTFMRVFIQYGPKSGGSDNYLRMNSDSGSNYTFIEDINNVARVSQTQIDLNDGDASATGQSHIIDIVNIPNLEKCFDIVSVRRITSAGSSQVRRRISGTWVNITNAISRLDLISSGVATYPIGTSIAIWGSPF